MQYEDNQLSFNLLALCKGPLALHSANIAKGIAALRHLHDHVQTWPDLSHFRPKDNFAGEATTPGFLSEFQLTLEDVQGTKPPPDLTTMVSTVSTVEEAQTVYDSLKVNIKATMGEYRAELISMAEDEQRVKGRKKDYGPALHKWVTKLAEKGLLEDMIKSS